MKLMKTLLILVFAGLACAQPPASQLTLGVPNCHGWMQGFNDGMRTGFVIGFNTAVLASGDKDMDAKYNNYPNVTFGDILKGVTALCQVPENGALPVHNMIMVFIDKSKGISQKEIDAELEELRKNVSEISSGTKEAK